MGDRTRRNVLKAGGLIAGGAVVLSGGAVLAGEEEGPRERPESARVTEVVEDTGASERTTEGTTRIETTERTESQAKTDSAGVTVVGARQQDGDERAGGEDVDAAAPSPLLGDDDAEAGSTNARNQDPMDFDLIEWDLLHRNRASETDAHGNKTGWTVEWRRDPSDPTRQGIKVELHMITGGYENDAAQIRLDFDPEHTDVERYLPGNTEMPGLGIDDDSELYSETIIQTYDVQGDLEGNTVRLAAAATTTTEPEPGATFVDVDVRSFYTDSLLDVFAVDRSEISNYYRYSWA